jgi:hypothetical protein
MEELLYVGGFFLTVLGVYLVITLLVAKALDR